MSTQIDEGVDMPKEAVDVKIYQERPNARVGMVLTDGTVRKVPALHDLRSLRVQTVRELDIPEKSGADLPSWGELREGWYEERLEKT